MLMERRDVRWTSTSLTIVFTLVAACKVAVADDVAVPPNPDLGELKAIRQDVRALRDDVRRLSALLEKRFTGTERSSTDPAIPKIEQLAERDSASKKIQQALVEPVFIDAVDTPLLEVIRIVKQTANINVVIDERALAEEGLRTNQLVSISVSKISMRSFLKLLLEPLNLTFVEQDEVLLITNEQRKRGELIHATYAVKDLLDSGLKTNNPANGSKSGDEPSKTGLAELRSLIVSTISPDSWDVAGGPGSLQTFDTTNSLVVRQTRDVHEQVGELLDQLRRIQRPHKSNEDQSIMETVYSVADLVIPILDGPGSRTKVNTSDWLKLVDRITQIEPTSWASNGGSSTVQAKESNYSLVIRAPQRIHQAITELLSAMRRDQDLQVCIAVNFLKVTDNEILEKTGIPFDPDPNTKMVTIDDQQAKQLIAAVQSGKGESTFAPKVTMFNGQIAYIGSEGPQIPIPKGGYELHLRGNISEDRRTVRLNLALNPESLVNDLIKNAYRVPDGGYLLLDMTDVPGTNSDNVKRSPDSEIPKKRLVRSLVLVQPRIIVPQEEEELLFPNRKP